MCEAHLSNLIPEWDWKSDYFELLPVGPTVKASRGVMINPEMRSNVAKMEMARMRENKMQAQVWRLRSRRYELLAARKGVE